MRLFIVYLWNYIRVLLYGKLFKKKGNIELHPTKEALNKTPYLTYRSSSVSGWEKTQ